MAHNSLPNNGSLKTWLLSALFTVLLSTGGWLVSSTTDRISNLEASVSDRSEKIAVLQTEVKEVRQQLNRMEDKLDELIEHTTKK